MTRTKRAPSASEAPDELRGQALRRALFDWYRAVGNARDLPWRRTRDPYAVWVSETMLQQTRVATVIPYWERFMRELPTVQCLAEAPEEQVLALWSGLGYYRRARMLHAAARRVAGAYGGDVPSEPDELRSLEGVGAYTAAAVASIAFKRRAPLVDGNVARVLARLFAVDVDIKSTRGVARLWELARSLMEGLDEASDPGEWNQALMELGATVCAPRDPACEVCPARRVCEARARGRVAELPRSAPKRPPQPCVRAAIVLSSARGVLLGRRRKEALFGGLWEPPGVDGEVEPLARALGVDAGHLTLAGRLVHVLSHRRLEVQVACGVLPARRRWPVPSPEYDAIGIVAFDALGTTAHSTLARKILSMANVCPGGPLPNERGSE